MLALKIIGCIILSLIVIAAVGLIVIVLKIPVDGGYGDEV